MDKLRLEWEPVVDALASLLADDKLCEKEAENLGYSPVKFSKMCVVVMHAATNALEGASLDYCYELRISYMARLKLCM